jgi:hypothetical protein
MNQLTEIDKDIVGVVYDALRELIDGSVSEIHIDTDGKRVYIKTVKKTVKKKAV